jgi:predicted nucleotidyltransferase
LGSVVVKSTPRKEIEGRVASLVAQWRREHPEIQRVIWFGSWVNDLPSPGSDVDLCIVLRDSPKPMRERIPDFLPVGFPVGIDIFPYTEREFRRLQERSPSFHAAIQRGRAML